MTEKHNKEIAETIKSALEFYKYELDLPLTNFIFQSPLHWNVMTIIALATLDREQTTSFQHLCESISPKTGSKSSIQSIIETGIQRGFIKKSPLHNDKRIKSLKLTETAAKDYENWVRADATTFGPLNGVAMKTPK